MSDDYQGKHEAIPVEVEVEATVVQTTPSTASSQLHYYAKAIVGGIVAGLTYLLTVLTPAATLGDVTLIQWIGFAVSVLGTGFGVGAVSNGPKPTKLH